MVDFDFFLGAGCVVVVVDFTFHGRAAWITEAVVGVCGPLPLAVDVSCTPSFTFPLWFERVLLVCLFVFDGPTMQF